MKHYVNKIAHIFRPAKALGLGLALTAGSISPSFAADDLNSLLKQLKSDRITESKENKAREAEFAQARNEQKAILARAKEELVAEEARSQQLSTSFDENETLLTELSETLKQRSGSLGELFGVVRQFANDNRGIFEASSVSAQYPNRTKFLVELSERKELPTTTELEQLWLEIHQEMTESGRVVKFPATVVAPGGTEIEKTVTRIGSFNTISDGQYLNYVPASGKFEILSPQPATEFTSQAAQLESNSSGFTAFSVDPTSGVLLSLLQQSPSVEDRIKQGGVVGYIILGLGAIGVLLAIFCGIRLMMIGGGIRKQLKSDSVVKGNPLGDIMATYQNNKEADVETLELVMDEVIIKSVPKIESGLPLIKLIATVAPLLGLLGTVVGMIGVFQAITLFGTGDPKLMAGGISEALVTTMLGLAIAIPTLFLHSMLNGKAKSLVQILEEQSAGFVARHKESLDASNNTATA